jgi:ribonuclease HI
MKTAVIYSDGASKGNPGDAGIGVVISDTEGNVVREVAEYIGKQTNNVAEYSALIRGLHEAADLGATRVEIRTDSELLARQLTGVYKVKAANLKPLFEEAIALLRVFERVSISHVVRELNKRADELANEGVEKHRNNRPGAGPGHAKPSASPANRPPGQGKLSF